MSAMECLRRAVVGAAGHAPMHIKIAFSKMAHFGPKSCLDIIAITFKAAASIESHGASQAISP